jgi:hypothetical protein
MKYLLIVTVAMLGACSAHVDVTMGYDAEADRAAHEAYLESIYNLDNYDPEYVDDCLYYEEVVCEFE